MKVLGRSPRQLNILHIPYSQFRLQFRTWMFWICEIVKSVYYTYRVQTQFPNTTRDGKALEAPSAVRVVPWPYVHYWCILSREKRAWWQRFWSFFRTKMSIWAKKTVVLSVLRFFKIKICCPLNFCCRKQLVRRLLRTLPLAKNSYITAIAII